jgi:hypothetical protein
MKPPEYEEANLTISLGGDKLPFSNLIELSYENSAPSETEAILCP